MHESSVLLTPGMGERDGCVHPMWHEDGNFGLYIFSRQYGWKVATRSAYSLMKRTFGFQTHRAEACPHDMMVYRGELGFHLDLFHVCRNAAVMFNMNTTAVTSHESDTTITIRVRGRLIESCMLTVIVHGTLSRAKS